MKLTRLFRDFIKSERAGGIILIICTAVSLVLANSPWRDYYQAIWNIDLGGHPSSHWINDGLMTIFFLLIGLELEREVYAGELSTIRNALLPTMAALGGMLVPAGIYLIFNFGKATQPGAGIPMATDIAFAIAVLSLLGKRIPASLKVLLTALAVIDDLGAITVIAVFYTSSLSWSSLGIAMGIFAILLALNRLKIMSLVPYLVGGVAMWYFMLHSGIHPTITGVLVAFAIPFGDGSPGSTSYKLQHFLHKPVALFILPIFALSNTCITLGDQWYTSLADAKSLGIFFGLAAGKPLGIISFSFAAVLLGICTLPRELNWKQVLGIGFLGGIGFTMSIFITLLAFEQPGQITQAKIAILIASCVAAILGYVWLKITLKERVLNT